MANPAHPVGRDEQAARPLLVFRILRLYVNGPAEEPKWPLRISGSLFCSFQ